MKKVIRLTENDLHRIVENSTRRILSELDWKTQQWAADERERRNNDVMRNGQKSQYFNKYQQQGLANGSMYGDFAMPTYKASQQQRNNQQAAIQQFNKDYGQDNTNLDANDGTYTNKSIGLNYNGTGVNGSVMKGNLNNNTSASINRNTMYDSGIVNRYNNTQVQKGGQQMNGSMMTTISKNGVSNTKNGNEDLMRQGIGSFNKELGVDFRKADDEVAAYRGGRYQYQKGRGWQQQ